jgi:hypothetical protein
MWGKRNAYGAHTHPAGMPDAVNVLSDKLVFKARLASVAGRDLWHP